jgi:hypothetical protein
MNVQEAAVQHRDWLALPTGVTQHIICFASTWQTPGPCLASLVCRTWRSAAAGCRDIRLLFHAGYVPADHGFAAWLAGNGRRLAALTLSSRVNTSGTLLVLEALAAAAAAAKAAGKPLPLQTLRVLGQQVNTQTVGRLLAALPNLRCLQLVLFERYPHWKCDENRHDAIMEDLAHLRRATQLQELYLDQRHLVNTRFGADVAGLLPLSLRRLSWESLECLHRGGNLSHLTQLTFLGLSGEPLGDLCSDQLPPNLQQLELWNKDIDLEVVEQHRQVLTGWRVDEMCNSDVRQQLARLPHLTAADLFARDVSLDVGETALAQLSKLSSLRVWIPSDAVSATAHCWGVGRASAAAASIRSLRRLHLRLSGVPEPTGLSAMAQLTQLRVTLLHEWGSTEQQQAWARAVGSLVGLRWLSVPAVQLVAGQAWLGGLQQLRVLVLHCNNPDDAQLVSSMSWVGAVSHQLHVLGVSGVKAEEGAALQLRRPLQQALGSRGCEVVVGVDLDAAAGPTQQLAGLPEALQQVLV